MYSGCREHSLLPGLRKNTQGRNKFGAHTYTHTHTQTHTGGYLDHLTESVATGCRKVHEGATGLKWETKLPTGC